MEPPQGIYKPAFYPEFFFFNKINIIWKKAIFLDELTVYWNIEI